jgi:hypothetical protein
VPEAINLAKILSSTMMNKQTSLKVEAQFVGALFLGRSHGRDINFGGC